MKNDVTVVEEPARQIKAVGDYDVIVCGGGPAGVAAALSAARAGARTALIDVAGCLGGVWTAGLLCHIIDHRNKSGIMSEILQRLEQFAGRAPDGASYQPEVMKAVLEQMCQEAGVRVRLHTRVAYAICDQKRLTFVMTESKSGREAWGAKVFIDATGDGDLAALAGCGFDIGHPQTGQCQPMSMMAVLTGLPWPEIAPMVCGHGDGHEKPKQLMLAELARAGLDPSYGRPTLFYLGGGLIAMMANHEYGVSALDADQITAATLRARAEVHRLVSGLRGLGGVWKNLGIACTAGHIGVREGRRIHGRYTVTRDDVASGARHEDAVCRATFCVDVHSTDPSKGKAYGSEGMRSQPYDIPLRALIAKDVDGLLMAGRCISGDFYAHASYRVTGNAVAMGEAAGETAARAARQNLLPQDLPEPPVREQLVSELKPA